MMNLFFIKQRPNDDIPPGNGNQAALDVSAGQSATTPPSEGASPESRSKTSTLGGAETVPAPVPRTDVGTSNNPIPPKDAIIGDKEDEEKDELKKDEDKDKQDRFNPGHVEPKTWHETLMELLKNNDLDYASRTVGHAVFTAVDKSMQLLSGGEKDFFTAQQKLNTELEKIPGLPGKLIAEIKDWFKGEQGIAEERGVEAVRDGAAAATPASTTPADALRRGADILDNAANGRNSAASSAGSSQNDNETDSDHTRRPR
jgi:hypothetical protein